MKLLYLTAALRGALFGLGSKSLLWGCVFILTCLVHEYVYSAIKEGNGNG